MSKKTGGSQMSLPSLARAKKFTPEGYYSGDKPNPNLMGFGQQHVKERPYDTATDKYDVPAFDKPIETTKATSIYNMHTYWSKKPHEAIREYIRHYTRPWTEGYRDRPIAGRNIYHEELLHTRGPRVAPRGVRSRA